MNALNIFLAAGAAYVLGGLWYSPFMFGKRWMRLSKKKEKDLKMTPAIVALGLVGTLMTAFVFSWLITQTSVQGTLGGMFFGVMLWAGFLLPFAANAVLYKTTSPQLFLIDSLYPLAGLILMGAILT